MFETFVTLIGNVTSKPQRRILAPNDTPVVDFQVVSQSRRFDRRVQNWVDGDRLDVKVVCWRSLSDRVFSSVSQGDPVLVHGRLATRSHLDRNGKRVWTTELEARDVGHNLAFGVSTFERRAKDESPWAGLLGAENKPEELDAIVLEAEEPSPTAEQAPPESPALAPTDPKEPVFASSTASLSPP